MVNKRIVKKFDKVVDRRGSDCYKWDSAHALEHGECLPLWVADMDFQAAPAILRALKRRLQHGVFGYTSVPDRYYEAIISWFGRRHGWTIQREEIIYTTGVVPAISAILRAMTKPGDEVMVHTPGYNCFFSSIANLGCKQVSLPLTRRDNHFEMDWQATETAMKTAKILIFCNPHNPTGRIWTREEVKQLATMAERNGVFVIADEIHCEFAFPGEQYTPYATVAGSKNYAVCTAASKAFNVAGLQCANIIVPDADHRARIDKAINIHEVCDINPFGMEALIAAYNESEDWLDSLNQYIFENYQWLCTYMQEHHPEFAVTRMEGTYLAWVDITASGMSDEAYCNQLADRAHVLLNPSSLYGAEGFVRINMACSRNILEKAVSAM